MRKLLAGIGILLSLLVGEASSQNYNLTGRKAYADSITVNRIIKNNPSTRIDSLDVFRRLDNMPAVRLEDYSTTLSDSNESNGNGEAFKRALKHAVNIGSALLLPSDTTYIDSLWFQNLNGISILGTGNSVLSFRSANKDDSTNTMLRFTDCDYVKIDGITFIGNMGAGSGNGYDNAVIPIYFQGGDDGSVSYGSCDYILIQNNIFKDCWWIGLGGRIVGGSVNSVADTVATHVKIHNNSWPWPAKRGPSENLGHKGINTLGIVQYLTISDNEFYSKNPDDGVIYANGFYLLNTVYDGIILDNKSYDAYDSDYYSFIRRGLIAGNYSENSGKDGIKNIRDTSVGASHPDWPGVGQVFVYGNYVKGTGRIILGSPVGYNFDGDRNTIVGNKFEGQDTTGYIAKQAQIAFRAGYTSTQSIFADNIIVGNNGRFSGRPTLIGFLLRDSITTREDAGLVISGNKIYDVSVGISSVNYNRFHKVIRNEMWGIDSVGYEDYPSESEKIFLLYNIIQAKYIFRNGTGGVDSLIAAFNAYLDYVAIQLPGSPPNGDSVYVDTLNLRIQ